VRVNIHFFQDNSGGNNFSRSGNGFTGFTGKNGVQIAEDLISQLNAIYHVNNPQRIPLNNNIPVKNKEIQLKK